MRTEITHVPRPATTEIPAKKHRAGKIVAAFTGLLLTTGVSYYGRILEKDVRRQPTAQEQLIEDATAKTFGSNITVRCLSPEQLVARRRQVFPLANDYPTAGLTIPGLPLIWLRNDMCDGISAFAANPPQTKNDLKIGPMMGLHALAHEYRHTQGTLNEAGANCEALQDVAELGEVLGAPPTMHDKMTHYATTMVMDEIDTLAEAGVGKIEAYRLEGVCIPGSRYDLHRTGRFPFPPDDAVWNG